MNRNYPSLHGMVFEIQSTNYENEQTIYIRMTSVRNDVNSKNDFRPDKKRFKHKFFTDKSNFDDCYLQELQDGFADLEYVSMFDDWGHGFPDNFNCDKKLGEFFCDVINAFENDTVFQFFCEKCGLIYERKQLENLTKKYSNGKPLDSSKEVDSFIKELSKINAEKSSSAYAEAVIATVFYFDKYSTISPLELARNPRYFSMQGYDISADFHYTRIITNVDLLMFDYSEMLRIGVKARRCKTCGKLFVPTSRSDEVYCDNILKDNKTCKEIGFAATIENNETLKIYRKIYKTQHARLMRIGKGSPQARKQFDSWRKYAHNQLILCRSGKISIEQMKESISMSDWLEGKKYVDDNKAE